jgi:hypothetical protein
VSYDKKQLIEYADQFDELNAYISKLKKGNANFYEISISDNGLGIINRFLATRPEYKSNADFFRLSEAEKINEIINKSLSSKPFEGSGRGLAIALNSIRELSGFASLRTGNTWAYFDGLNKEVTNLSFQRVNKDVSPMRGTNYNILIPITR